MLEAGQAVELGFDGIREALASLPRTDNHAPGEHVDPREVYAAAGHRNALDPERTLVVGNRGMGKSFWAHALENPTIRRIAADYYGQPALASTDVVMGFNASERLEEVAPPIPMIAEALRSGVDYESIWRAVLVRAVHSHISVEHERVPASFLELCSWVDADAERYLRLVTDADLNLLKQKRRLLIVFDALDRLGNNWSEQQRLTRALLSRALAARSYKAIRFKLFMRPDQYTDTELFAFPDASKIQNDRVDLAWSSEELYGLLFQRLQLSERSKLQFRKLVDALGISANWKSTNADTFDIMHIEDQRKVVNRIAGEFMGASAKRGRVYTWLPTHLGDAAGETSPRTFLTAWHVAANHMPAPIGRAVDYLGLSEGVRRASQDRLSELQQDYQWIKTVLRPLAGESVPMPWTRLQEIWQHDNTVQKVESETKKNGWLVPIFFTRSNSLSMEYALLLTLRVIGVMEMRANEKVNVPDIFRVDAQIKRRGGVKPPRGRI
jgi:hypothetical protein